MTHQSKGKFVEKWKGYCMIDAIFSNGTYMIANENMKK